jgi:hypothetical protein
VVFLANIVSFRQVDAAEHILVVFEEGVRSNIVNALIIFLDH